MTSVETIQALVAAEYGITVADILGTDRRRKYLWPRQVAMWVCCETLGMSAGQIGRGFKRDRSTVWHAHRKVARDLENHPHMLAKALAAKVGGALLARKEAA